MVLRNPKIFQNVFSKSNKKNKCDSSSFDFAKCSSVSIPIIMRPKIESKDISSDIESVTSEASVRSKASRLVSSVDPKDDDDFVVDDDDDRTIDTPPPKKIIKETQIKKKSTKTGQFLQSLQHLMLSNVYARLL